MHLPAFILKNQGSVRLHWLKVDKSMSMVFTAGDKFILAIRKDLLDDSNYYFIDVQIVKIGKSLKMQTSDGNKHDLDAFYMAEYFSRVTLILSLLPA